MSGLNPILTRFAATRFTAFPIFLYQYTTYSFRIGITFFDMRSEEV